MLPNPALFRVVSHWLTVYSSLGFPGGASGKEPACQCRRLEFDPWARKIPWKRAWQTTPVFLPEESPGQRSLAGYSPWGHTESDTTEVTWQQQQAPYPGCGQQTEAKKLSEGHRSFRLDSLRCCKNEIKEKVKATFKNSYPSVSGIYLSIP